MLEVSSCGSGWLKRAPRLRRIARAARLPIAAVATLVRLRVAAADAVMTHLTLRRSSLAGTGGSTAAGEGLSAARALPQHGVASFGRSVRQECMSERFADELWQAKYGI